MNIPWCKPNTSGIRRCSGKYRERSQRFSFRFRPCSYRLRTEIIKSGDEVIAVDDLRWYLQNVYPPFRKYQLKFTFVNFDDVSKIAELINDKTKLIWLETPTNPLMKLVDIKAVADLIQGKIFF